MEALEMQIGEVSAVLKRAVVEDGRTRILTTIPGVGYYTVLLLVAEIGDINRFPDAEKLCSYAGLVLSVRRSGGSTVHGHITKERSRRLRWGLTEAVHSHLRYDTELTRFRRRLAHA